MGTWGGVVEEETVLEDLVLEVVERKVKVQRDMESTVVVVEEERVLERLVVAVAVVTVREYWVKEGVEERVLAMEDKANEEA
jgi:hypothetical protein